MVLSFRTLNHFNANLTAFEQFGVIFKEENFVLGTKFLQKKNKNHFRIQKIQKIFQTSILFLEFIQQTFYCWYIIWIGMYSVHNNKTKSHTTNYKVVVVEWFVYKPNFILYFSCNTKIHLDILMLILTGFYTTLNKWQLAYSTIVPTDETSATFSMELYNLNACLQNLIVFRSSSVIALHHHTKYAHHATCNDK